MKVNAESVLTITVGMELHEDEAKTLADILATIGKSKGGSVSFTQDSAEFAWRLASTIRKELKGAEED